MGRGSSPGRRYDLTRWRPSTTSAPPSPSTSTWPTRAWPPRSSSPCGSSGRCCSRARPASARPRSPRCWPAGPAASWSASSATRASTPPRRSTSGTTPASCSTSGRSRPAAVRWSRTSSTPSGSSCGGRCCGRSPTRPTAWRSRAPVLLVDEVDRADDEFEAFLLEILSDYTITVPELGTFRASVPPLVVVTSNRTRDVHDALKRRCLYHWIDAPRLRARARHPPRAGARGARRSWPAQVAAAVEALRDLELYKPPGVAETIDWANALAALGRTSIDEQAVDGHPRHDPQVPRGPGPHPGRRDRPAGSLGDGAQWLTRPRPWRSPSSTG